MFGVRKVLVVSLGGMAAFFIALTFDTSPVEAGKKFRRAVGKVATSVAINGAKKMLRKDGKEELADNDDDTETPKAATLSVVPAVNTVDPSDRAAVSAARAKARLDAEREIPVALDPPSGKGSDSPRNTGVVCIAGCYYR